MKKNPERKPRWLLEAEERDRLGMARTKGMLAWRRTHDYNARNEYQPNSNLGRAWRAGLLEAAERESPW